MADIQLYPKERRVVMATAIFAGICLAIAYGAEWGAATFSSQSQRENAVLKQEQDNFQERLATIQDEERLQNQYAQSYRDWEAHGLLGEESRLAWVETLQTIQERRNLFPISYQISAQEVFDSDSSVYTENSSVSVQASPMTIKMGMLHVLDVLLFLNDYAKEVSGVFIPTFCRVDRHSSRFEAVNRPNMTGECRLEWITVADPDKGLSREEQIKLEEERRRL